ncbi:MAG: HD domain-containing protein [Phormidesmis sp.]
MISLTADPSKVMTAQFLKALQFAAHKHRHQRRKDVDKTPYINHPIAVANVLLNEASVTDETVLIAALLHDTVEDTDATFEEIEQQFGRAVRDIVSEVTDDKSLPKAVRKQRQVEHAPGLSDRARLLKLADKTANLRDIAIASPEGWTSDRINEYVEWGKAVVDNIRGTHLLLEQLFDSAYAQGKAAAQSQA